MTFHGCSLLWLAAGCAPAHGTLMYCDAHTPCTDPGRPICDPATHECQAGRVGADLGAGCMKSSDCSPDRPLCEAGSCRACVGSSDDAACQQRAAATPLCAGASGRCVACRPDRASADCARPDASVCDPTTNACRGCRDHGECPSGACLLDGTCAPDGQVTFVDNRGDSVAGCFGSHGKANGARVDPWCDVQDGVDSGRPFVVIAPSPMTYGTVLVGSGKVSLLGPLGPSATPPRLSSRDPTPVVSLQTSGSASLTLVGLELSSTSAGQPGVFCATGGSASLSLSHVSVHDSSGYGIKSFVCTLSIDASRIHHNKGGGLYLDSGAYAITNSFFTDNGSSGPALNLYDDAGGLFAFNTVAGNATAGGPGGIVCGGAGPKLIQDSIVVGNALSAGSQFFGACTLANVVTGAGDSAGGLALLPAFLDPTRGDYHLRPADPRNADCCIDRVPRPGTANADHDVDGSARPKGAAWDVGAHEAR